MFERRDSAYASAVKRLNMPQREALFERGNAALLAGPGSGKTATLVLKIARLLDEIPAPRGVACLTYGNEAAREFESRLGDLGIRRGGRLFTGTVHAFCLAHVLRPFARRLPGAMKEIAGYEVASDDEMAYAREKGLEAAGVNEKESWWGAKISAYRRIVLVDSARRAEFTDDRLPVIADGYRKALRAAKRVDFDDIVFAALKLIETDEHVRRVLAAKYPWFVIDEYQDLGLALHRIVVTLIEKGGVKVFAVGDPDQSIYGFTGARPEFLNELKSREDVRPIRLELNYRCRQKIIDASLHVLQPDEERGFRAALEDDGEEEIVFHECEEGLSEQATRTVGRVQQLVAAGVPPGEIGILASRWQDLNEFKDRFDAAGIPYRIAKTPTYKATPLTMWVEDMAAWCAAGRRHARPRLVKIFATWERILLTCRGESQEVRSLRGRVALYQALRPLCDPNLQVGVWLRALDEALGLRGITANAARVPLRMRHDVRELGAMLQALEGSQQPIEEFSGIARNKVVFQSIHGSKGLEYTAIFIPALENGVLPRYGEDGRESRRLFYVAITRARREVHLLWSGFLYTAEGKFRQRGPSPLLIELSQRLHRE